MGLIKLDRLTNLLETAEQLAEGKRQKKFVEEACSEFSDLVEELSQMDDYRAQLIKYLSENKEDPERCLAVREVLEILTD